MKILGLIAILVLAVTHASTLVGADMQSTVIISSLGNVSSSNIIFFSDGFENNVPMEVAYNGSLPLEAPTVPIGWTTNDIDAILLPNGTITGPSRVWIVQDETKAHHGEFSARYLAGPATPPATRYSLLMKRWWINPQTPQELTEFYVRWYQKFEVLPTSWGGDIIPFYMLGVKYSDSQITGYYMKSAEVMIVMKDTLKIAFNKLFNNGSQFSAGLKPVDLVTNQWYTFEVWYKSDPLNGEYKLWLDEQELFSVTGINSTPPAQESHPNGFDLGISRGKTNGNYTAWIDCVVAANYRVGPESWFPSETVTVTIQVFDNNTKNYLPNSSVKMDSYEGYTNKSGFVTFSEVPFFSSYTLNISKSGYERLTELVSVFGENTTLQFYLDPIPENGILEIQAYADQTEVVATVEISNPNGVVATIETTYSLELSPGTYMLRAIYDNQTLTKTEIVSEGKTTSVEFLFKGKNEAESGGVLPLDIKTTTLIFISVITGAVLIALYKKFG